MKQVAGMLLGPAGTLVSLTFQRRPADGQPFVRAHTVLRRVDVRALRASHEQHAEVNFFLTSRSRSLSLRHALYVTLSSNGDERGLFRASASVLSARQR